MNEESFETLSVAGRLLWAVTLLAASFAFSLSFACAVPLAGFAAIAVLTMGRLEAILLIVAIFLTNQCVGFGLLNYPRTPDTFAWGGVMAAVAVATVLAAGWIQSRLAGAHRFLRIATVFFSAFGVYEVLLFVATAISGSGFEAYSAAVIGRILLINLVSFIVLFVGCRLVVIGVAKRNLLHWSAQAHMTNK